MKEGQVPEIADGGYWYIANTIPDPEEGGKTPDVPAGVSYCVWYGVELGSTDLCVVRTTEPVGELLKADISNIAQVLGNRKPRGRVGGR